MSIANGTTVRLPDNTTGLVVRTCGTDVHVSQPTFRGSRRYRTDIWHVSQVAPVSAKGPCKAVVS